MESTMSRGEKKRALLLLKQSAVTQTVHRSRLYTKNPPAHIAILLYKSDGPSLFHQYTSTRVSCLILTSWKFIKKNIKIFRRSKTPHFFYREYANFFSFLNQLIKCRTHVELIVRPNIFRNHLLHRTHKVGPLLPIVYSNCRVVTDRSLLRNFGDKTVLPASRKTPARVRRLKTNNAAMAFFVRHGVKKFVAIPFNVLIGICNHQRAIVANVFLGKEYAPRCARRHPVALHNYFTSWRQ